MANLVLMGSLGENRSCSSVADDGETVSALSYDGDDEYVQPLVTISLPDPRSKANPISRLFLW